MNLAKTERAALCLLLDAVGPEAPTLAGDWTTHDLACHLWVRENDMLAAPGIALRPLAHITARRMEECKRRFSYTELVDKIRNGPAAVSIFAIPGIAEAANGIEYFVHHEDVRRAGPHPLRPRVLAPEVQDFLWKRLRVLGRALLRKAPVGVLAERPDGGEPLRLGSGTSTVTITGMPSELVLFVFGRKDAADVAFIGESEAVRALQATELSV